MRFQEKVLFFANTGAPQTTHGDDLETASIAFPETGELDVEGFLRNSTPTFGGGCAEVL